MPLLNAITSALAPAPDRAWPLGAPSPQSTIRNPQSQSLSHRQESFASVLGRSLSPAADAALTPAQRARDAAEQLVTQTFVLPLLKQVRESDRTAAPFAQSQAEKQFRALADAELAQRIVQAARFPLVDRLARDLLKKGGKDGQDRSVNDALNEARSTSPRPTPGVLLGADTR